MSKNKSILLKTDHLERKGTAEVDLRTGIFLKRTVDKVSPFATAGAIPDFKEISIQPLGKSYDHTYKKDEDVTSRVPRRGDYFNMRVEASTSIIAEGDDVQISATGTVEKKTSATNKVIGRACESIDNSGSNSDTFIKIELL